MLVWRGLRTVGAVFGLAIFAAGMVLIIFNWGRNSTAWTGRPESYRLQVIVALAAVAALPAFVFTSCKLTAPTHRMG